MTFFTNVDMLNQIRSCRSEKIFVSL